MTKKNKTSLIILSAVLVVCLTIAALSFNDSFVLRLSGGIDTSSGEALSTVVQSEYVSDYPLVQTELENVFYELHPNGEIKYYKYSDEGFAELTNVKKKDIKITCSYQKIPMTLYYLDDTDVGTIGYGLFTAEQDKAVQTFSYILARLVDCPSSYKNTARTSHVLLLDMDSDDSYKINKTYSDIYSYDMSSGTTTLIVSSRDRTVQEDATQNETWTIFTDESVNSMCKYDWFASTRYHDTNAEKLLYDFMSVASSRQVRKNTSTEFVGSPSYHIWEKDGSIYFFSDTDEGFDLIKDENKNSPLKSFEGSFSDYAVSGHFILDPTKMDFTDAYTGETQSVKKARFDSLAGFAASPGGQQFAVFCNGKTQAMIMYDTEIGNAKIISDSNIFNSGICNFSFINNKTMLVSAYAEDDTTINRIINFK